jgi:hypothetical protein
MFVSATAAVGMLDTAIAHGTGSAEPGRAIEDEKVPLSASTSAAARPSVGAASSRRRTVRDFGPFEAGRE